MKGVVVLLAACAASEPASPPPTVPAQTVAKPAAPQPKPRVVEARAAPVQPPLPPVAAPYPPNITSVRFTKDAPIHVEPDEKAKRIGTATYNARVVPHQARPPGAGCEKRWIELEPRGWVCETFLSPSTQPPSTIERVSLHDTSAPKMGVYGVVNKGALGYDSADDVAAGNGHAIGKNTTVRGGGLTEVDGEKYWITTEGTLIAASSIDGIAPSQFHGVPIDDGKLHVGWAHAHDTEDHRLPPPVPLRAGPAADAPIVGKLKVQTEVEILEVSGAFVRVKDGAWVARNDIRAPSPAAPPDGVGEHDRWFDVDLAEQVLVAYEGTRPVYATLVSTGKRTRETPPEVKHVTEKHLAADMNSDLIDVYSVAEVPWTMFYDRNLALHAAYWHDEFGDVHSHGCVNLAPRDARLLFDWASPVLPAGWSSVYDDGSIVRVR